jgi:hypothetical protein
MAWPPPSSPRGRGVVLGLPTSLRPRHCPDRLVQKDLRDHGSLGTVPSVQGTETPEACDGPRHRASSPMPPPDQPSVCERRGEPSARPRLRSVLLRRSTWPV